MTRVLQIVDCMDLGGIQTFIMNTYKKLINDDIQFDFLVFHDKKQFYEDEILSLGGKIYKLPSRRDGITKCKKALNIFFKEHQEYSVVHYHTSSLSFIIPLIIAKRNNVPIRIIHSHSTRAPGNKVHTILHYINRKRIIKYATHFFSCGKLAAEWMFKSSGCDKNIKMINNGINIEDYIFNQDERNIMRDNLGLDGTYVIGHVGRFSKVKNHEFIIRIFLELTKRGHLKNPRLLLVGDGEEQQNIRNKVIKYGLLDKVLFLGQRSDVPSVLQAMDCFLMPSLYEGFPVAAIEAQAVGLPCFLSDSITSDAKLKSNVHFIGLEENIEDWCDIIEKENTRVVNNETLYENGYDISNTIIELKKVYLLIQQ